MNMTIKMLAGVAVTALILSAPASAETTKSVTQKNSTVNPDGSVSYESHTVTTQNTSGTSDAVNVVTNNTTPLMTFYYYNPNVKRIVSGSDLTPDIISLWDTNNNKVIDNHEFYTDAIVMYEPIEYSKRTYQDIDGNGIPELTTEEYTQRLQKLPNYSSLNKNGKDGLTLYEFTGVGFQDADKDNDNQVSYDELREAFYHEKGLIAKPEKINQ